MQTRYTKNGSARYRDKIYIKGKPITSPWLKRKADVKAWRYRIERERDKISSLGDTYFKKVIFSEFFKTFMERRVHLEASTIRSYQGIYELHLKTHFADTALKDINLIEGENLKMALSKNVALSIGRQNNILRLLKVILNEAVKLDYLFKSPFKNLNFIKSQPKELEYWLQNDINKFFLKHSNSHYRSLVLVALNTGMRHSEIFGLTWDSIDFLNEIITVKQQRNRDGVKKTLKGKKVRYLKMNHLVLKELKALDRSRIDSCYVFLNTKGEAIETSHFTGRVFNKMVTEANVKKIRFHDLRTTYASNFCMQGGDIYALSRLLGHSSVKITEEKYAHLHPSYLGNQAASISLGLIEERPQERRLKLV